MPLHAYRAKRNFARTAEPRGATGASAGRSFVIQKHAASHLHYDFRLELDGVLLSWAVPKGPSLDPADKRLAMQVEDHPVEYGGFEGTIPKGEYGGGTVMLWDRGTWTPIGDARKALAKGHLKFELHGQRLGGAWDLIRTRGSKYGGKAGDRAWLLIKENDAHAHAGGASVVDANTRSVATDRDMDAIAKGVRGKQSAIPKAPRARAKEAATSRAVVVAPSPSKAPRRGSTPGATAMALPGARKAAMPRFIAPMLATLVKEAPPGDEWIHEIKYDGYRMVAAIEGGKARLYSRNEKEWTAAFASIARDLAALPVERAWLDGEVVVLDRVGRSSFQALQNALDGTSKVTMSYFAFDLLYVDGIDVRDCTLVERKKLLRTLLKTSRGSVRVGPEITGHGEDFFAQACKLGLEGSIAKRADSRYASGGRPGDWRKIKCIQRQEMVIGGYTDPRGARTGFGALLLGHYEGDRLRYAGKVGTGFDDHTLRSLEEKLARRERKDAPFFDPPRGFEAKGVHWVRPDLVAEIAFTEWSRDGALRHPSFQGLRPDKRAKDVVRETPMTTRSTRAAAKTPVEVRAKVPAKTTVHAVSGIALSNPDKPYFPEDGITKAELAAYYAAIAPRLLPHIAGRPLSLVRCPDGWTGQCFYQKHADKAVHAAVDRLQVPEGGGTATYMSAHTAAGLVALVQWGVIELHPWGSRTPRLAKPDRLIFDFDPDPEVSYADLAAGVQLLRTLLDEMKLVSFLKTTGGKGLHVVVPIRATLPWTQAKAFCKDVAEFMVRTFPDRFVATANKEKRKGRIFLDYLRNAEGATAVAPYSARAREHAPVAMPIAWDSLSRDLRGDHFNVRNVIDEVDRRSADPWGDFFTVKQSITAAMRKRIG